MSDAVAGYYPDPEDPEFERYWDGEAWTGVRRPQPAHRARSRKGSWFGGRSARERDKQPSTEDQDADLEQARAEIRWLSWQLAENGALELGELRRIRDELATEIASQQQRLDELLQFDELAEAVEHRQSVSVANGEHVAPEEAAPR